MSIVIQKLITANKYIIAYILDDDDVSGINNDSLRGEIMIHKLFFLQTRLR